MRKQNIQAAPHHAQPLTLFPTTDKSTRRPSHLSDDNGPDRAALGLVALLDGLVAPLKQEALAAMLHCRMRIAVGTLVNAHLLAEADGDAVVAAFCGGPGAKEIA